MYDVNFAHFYEQVTGMPSSHIRNTNFDLLNDFLPRNQANRNFFSVWLLGFILADGCVHSRWRGEFYDTLLSFKNVSSSARDHGIIRFVHNRVNFFGGRAVNPYPHAHKLGTYFSGFGTRDLLMDGIRLLIENQIPLYGKLSLLSELLVTNAHLPASVLSRAAGRRQAFDTFLTNDVDDIESIPNLPIRSVIAQ